METLFVHFDIKWNEQEDNEFCGWNKSSKWLERVKEPLNVGLDVYEWAYSIAFDATELMVYVDEQVLDGLENK